MSTYLTVKVISPRTSGLAKWMLKKNKKAVYNPRTEGIIVRRGNKFIELVKEET